MKRAILLIPLTIATAISAHAQSVGPATLNATGGTQIIGSNEFDWSVGEMTLVSTFSNANIIVTQGLLQPVGSDKTGVANNVAIGNQLKVFPNPASSVLSFQYISQRPGTLEYRMVDMTGKASISRTINIVQGNNEEQIDLTHLSCATYFLEVTVNSGSSSAESISYKIQKIK